MTPDEALEQIAGIVGAVFNVPPASITRATVAEDVPGWDSLTHVYLILEMERRFAVRLPVEEVFSLENVGGLVDLIAKHYAAKSA